MAVPACLKLADDVFPRVRARTAHALAAAGWPQTRIATALGISQAMVSRHLAATAPSDPLVVRLADELAHELQHPDEASPPSDTALGGGPSAWCVTLSQANARPGAGDALADLLAAEALLRRTVPARVMPQIGLNLARAAPDATSPADVASFPGRLVEASGALLRPAAPAFGASGHLARCLLELRQRDPAVAALGNVRGGADVARAAARLGTVLDVRRTGRTAAGTVKDPEAPFRQAVARLPVPPHPVAFVHDAGAVGLEACLYVAGRDAVAVAQTILQLDALVNA